LAGRDRGLIHRWAHLAQLSGSGSRQGAARAVAEGARPRALAATQHGFAILIGCESQRRELGTGMRATAEGLALAAPPGAPEIGPADLERHGVRALLGDDGVRHRKTLQA